MILGKMEMPNSYVSEYGLETGILRKLNELYNIPCVNFLRKRNLLENIKSVGYNINQGLYYVIWEIPERDETIFWLKFSNTPGVEYIDEIQITDTV